MNTQQRRNTLRVALAFSIGFAGMVGASRSAQAEETANLNVSATVTANCTISTSALAFGSYDPISAHASDPLEAEGAVHVTCTNGSAATITLGQGANADTGSTDAAPLRRLTDGSAFLSYALYSDAGRTTVWGNDATVDVDHTGTGAQADLTVYGRIAAAQNRPAGSYTDTVVATVTF